MVPPPSHKVPRVSWYSGYRLVRSLFGYGAFTLSGRLSQNRSPVLDRSLLQSEPRHARMTVWALPRSLAATYGIDVSFSSSGYLDVSVPRVPLRALWIHARMTEVPSAGFPHSEIPGSQDMCSSPGLIAACHVFHRLSVPRHPPCALLCLTFCPPPSLLSQKRRLRRLRASVRFGSAHGRTFLMFFRPACSFNLGESYMLQKYISIEI